jgi:hypothetical protein
MYVYKYKCIWISILLFISENIVPLV